jgi:branched-chain amino acid transport system permease protein
MDIFLQQIINGLVQGSIYALVALGYTMVYGIMGLINFAHGEVVMIGTLVTITVAGTLIKAGMPVALAGLAGLAAAVLVCMALGWALERVAYRPLRNAPRLTPLITAIGMSIVLQNVAMMIWGRNYLTFPPLLPKVNFELAGAHFTAIQVIIVLVSAADHGRTAAPRLSHQAGHGDARHGAESGRGQPDGGQQQPRHFRRLRHRLGARRAGRGHGRHLLRNRPLSDGLHARAEGFHRGGAGRHRQPRRRHAGGILLGLIEALGAGYIGDLTGGFLGSHYQDIFAFVVLIVVLMFKPSGLFGEKTGDRA